MPGPHSPSQASAKLDELMSWGKETVRSRGVSTVAYLPVGVRLFDPQYPPCPPAKKEQVAKCVTFLFRCLGSIYHVAGGQAGCSPGTGTGAGRSSVERAPPVLCSVQALCQQAVWGWPAAVPCRHYVENTVLIPVPKSLFWEVWLGHVHIYDIYAHLLLKDTLLPM